MSGMNSVVFNWKDAINFDCSILSWYTQQLYNAKEDDEIVDGIPLHRRKISLLFQPGLYRTLAYISTLFNNIKIIEMGTKFGLSALCLSYNLSNKVESYDIEDQGQFLLDKKDNLSFYIENLLEKNLSKLLSAELLFIDIAPHDGIQEQVILDFLLSHNYGGTIIWDDIQYGSPEIGTELIAFWRSITLPKFNISRCRDGGLGLGIVDLSDRFRVM